MTDRDDPIKHALALASGSPTLTARDELMESLMARIDDGGSDVADAPLPAKALTAVSGGRPVRSRRSARLGGIGVVGIVVLTVGTAAAASVGAWLALNPHTPVGPVVSTIAPTEDNLTVPPVISPEIERVTGNLVESVTPPLESFHGTDEVLPAPLEPLASGLPVADVLGPVISGVSVGELSGSVLDILTCVTGAPLSATVTDDSEVATVGAHITALGGAVDTTVPLAKTATDSWSGTIPGLKILQVVPLGSLATVTVEATDSAGNTSTTPTSVPLRQLLCG